MGYNYDLYNAFDVQVYHLTCTLEGSFSCCVILPSEPAMEISIRKRNVLFCLRYTNDPVGLYGLLCIISDSLSTV